MAYCKDGILRSLFSLHLVTTYLYLAIDSVSSIPYSLSSLKLAERHLHNIYSYRQQKGKNQEF